MKCLTYEELNRVQREDKLIYKIFQKQIYKYLIVNKKSKIPWTEMDIRKAGKMILDKMNDGKLNI